MMTLRRVLTRIGTPEPPPPWGFWDAAYALSILLITTFLLGPVIALLIFSASPNVLAPLAGWALGGLLMVAYGLFVYVRKPAFRAALRIDSPSFSALPLLLLCGVGVAMLFDVLNYAFVGAFIFTPSMANAPVFQASEWLAAFVLLVAAQPLSEELVFRGILLPRFRVWFGSWYGISTCSLLYALYSFAVYPPTNQSSLFYWYGLVVPFAFSLFFCCLRAYTGSTRAAIWVHMGFGLFILLKTLVLVR